MIYSIRLSLSLLLPAPKFNDLFCKRVFPNVFRTWFLSDHFSKSEITSERRRASSELSSSPPCIMCVQYRGGAQYRGGVQYRGGIS